MDAHLFRRLARALVPVLTGARLVKIQEPHEGIFTFNLDLFSRSSSLGRKVQLVLSPGRKDPFLFLSTARLAAGSSPSAMVMRLRKYAGGRSIRHAAVLWQARELHLLLSGAMPAEFTAGEGRTDGGRDGLPAGDAGESARSASGGERLTWLVLSLRDGPSLRFSEADELPGEDAPRWPGRGELAAAMEDWRSWPVLTPALRRTLARLDGPDAAALLIDLEDGAGDIFCYTTPAQTAEGRPQIAQVSAWPLPDELRKGQEEQCREDIVQALMEAGSDLVLGAAARRRARQAADPWRRKERKLEELLELHEEDVARLEKMRGRQQQGLLIQANLWQLPAGRRMESVELTDFEGAARTLRLDARYTVRENMERFFHTARRGERGLERVRTRKAELEAELARVRREKEACLMGASASVPETARNRTQAPMPQAPATVQLFVSSDGLALLRGRSARGNQDARRMAAPHDLWVHVEGGPGAHVIIRRDHAAQEVPERTLDEAGSLAACRSWLRDEPRAKVNYCEIRHVRPLRGAAPGTMRMDKILFTRQVPVRPELETALLPRSAGAAPSGAADEGGD